MKGFSIAGIVCCLAGIVILFAGIISGQESGSIIPHIPIAAVFACIGLLFVYLSKWRRRNGNNSWG